jgi:flavodoxin
MINAIILYYSRSGNTEKLANRIRESLGCDILKIEPEEAYGNYIASVVRVMGERAKKAPPKFVTDIPDLTEYSVVLLGYPVWAQDLPEFVAEFVSRCDLKGKTVIPFVTYGVQGVDWTMKTLRRVCGGAEIALPFNYGVFKKDNYDEWMQSVKNTITTKD